MPQYIERNPLPNPLAEAAGRFAQGYANRDKELRQQKAEQDILNSILNPQQQEQSYSGRPYDAVHDVMKKSSNRDDTMRNIEPKRERSISPEQYAQLELHAPKVAKALKPAFESQQKIKEIGIKADVKRSSEFLDKADKAREGIPRKEMSLKQIKDANATRSNIDFLGDQLAAITGNEAFRSAKGSQLLSATKEFFISDLGAIPGVRLNQFIEKSLSAAFTDPSRRQESNEIVAAGMESNLLLDKAKDAITSQLESQYRQSLGYVPPSISEDVNRALLPVAEQIQDKWARDVAEIQEKHNSSIQRYLKADTDKKRQDAASKVKLKRGEGRPLTETMGRILLDKNGDDVQKALNTARNLGYIIPGEE